MNGSDEMQDVTMEGLGREDIEESMVMKGIQSQLYLDLRTAAWDTVAHWRPTYWKSLPTAHRLKVRGANLRSDKPKVAKDVFFHYFCRAYQDWFAAEPRWYVSPWAN
jgi:hypothetical protein